MVQHKQRARKREWDGALVRQQIIQYYYSMKLSRVNKPSIEVGNNNNNQNRCDIVNCECC